MAVPIWKEDTFYAPGDIVQPKTVPAPQPQVAIENPGFETGDITGWTSISGAWHASQERDSYEGSYQVATYSAYESRLVSNTKAPVRPGTTITASCQLMPTRGSDRGCVMIFWYDEAKAPLPGDDAATYLPFEQQVQGTGGWRTSTLTATVPAAARYAAIGCFARKYTNSYFGADAFWWSLPDSPTDQGLLYRAVQPETGRSAATEPAWPQQLGLQVVDNQVIWEAISATRIVWKAHPILKSGDTEPAWPQSAGDVVRDGTIVWEVASQHITDPKCPNSPIAAKVAGKIYMGDNDIIPFCATNNPLDWSSRGDAGFLPFGMNPHGAMPCSALGLYRGNLAAFSRLGMQLWQVDPDPSANSLIDDKPLGSSHHRAMVQVGNELAVLSPVGIRTVGIAAGSTNLQVPDLGNPVDPLVRQLLRETADHGGPIASYLMAHGQYWCAFGTPVGDGGGGTVVVVGTMNQPGAAPAMSIYQLPDHITDFLQVGEALYARSDAMLYRIDAGDPQEVEYMDHRATPGGVEEVGYDVRLAWHFLDFGQPGRDKKLESFNYTGYGQPSIRFFWDQRDLSAATPPYLLPEDSVPGNPIPMEITAPSMSVELVYDGNGQYVEFNALTLHFNDRGSP